MRGEGLFYWVSKTIHGVVVHHSRSLHEGVADGTADELKAPFFQILTHGVAFRGVGGNLGKFLPFIFYGLPSDKGPEVFAESSKLVANLKIRLGVDAHGINLEPVADDPWVFQNLF